MLRVLLVLVSAALLIVCANLVVILDPLGGGKTASQGRLASAVPTRARPTPTIVPTPTIAPTPTIDRTPQEGQIRDYARAVGISVTCVKAYVASHNDFPNTVKELADFRASAPPAAQCR